MTQYQGVWTLQNAAQLQSTQRWVTDPLFENTTLLLQADDAANGSQNNTFIDSSGNGLPLNRLPVSGPGAPTQGTFTPFSSQPGAWSNFFGGSTDYIAFTSIAAYGVGTGNFSVQTFVNFNSISGNQRIFCLGASGTDGINVQFAGSTTQLQLDIANTRIITHTWTPVVGTWYQIDVVRAGTGTNQTTLYINGLSVATGTSSGSVGQNAANIGGLSWNSSFTVNGYVSNVRFSNTARSISAVTTNYSSDANTLLLTAQSNRFVDNSSTGNTFTIGGTPSVQPFSPFAPQFQWTPSVIGGSGYFDGSTDNIQTTGASTNLSIGTGDFTFECWVYLLSGAGDPGIMQIAGGPFGTNLPTYANSIGILTSTSSGLWLMINNGGFTAGSISRVLNSWTHLAVCRSGTTHRLFVNGVQALSVSDSSNYTTQYFAAGCAYGTNFTSNSYISNIRFVRGTAVYTGAFTPPTRPLSASGADSASAYPSTTNVNTSFAASATSLFLNFTNAGIVDATMKNNLETVGNAQVSTAVVKYGSGSMFFDGSGDYLTSYNVGGLFRLGPVYTVEMWFYTTTVAAGNAGLINFATTISGNTGFNLYRSSAEILCNDGATGGTGPSSGAGSVVANVWTHLAVVSNGVTTKVYLDGVERGSFTGTTGSANTMLYVTIGSFNDKSSPFSGYIDDLRVTRGIARYTQNFIPPSVALPRQ